MIHPDKLFGRLGNRMFQMSYIYAQMLKGEIPDIYVQDQKYFEKYEKEIKELFRPGIGRKVDQVAIHVRRGDYVNNPFYVDLTKTNYYKRAMELFPGAEFIVFSDDIEWCKHQVAFMDCEFAEGTELEDMNLMAACKGHIIANSSFSWWAAYLSPYSEKVVSPSVETLWYTDKVIRTNVPSTWIQLER